MKYLIKYSPDAVDQLEAFRARDQRIVSEAISEQLAFQPATPTKNRKRLRPTDLAVWELRVGRFRVYYNVEDEPKPQVDILLIGIKDRDVVTISGKVIEL